MANKARGETVLPIDGKNYVLCMTLGALAQIEDEFGIEDLSQLGELFKKPSSKKLLALVSALIRGGASSEAAQPDQASMTSEVLGGMGVSLPAALQAMKEAFKLTGLEDEAEGPSAEGKEPEAAPEDPELPKAG